MFDVLVHSVPVDEVIHRTPEIDLAVSSIDLAGAELAFEHDRPRARATEGAAPRCGTATTTSSSTPPRRSSSLTINALTADSVIVPVQCEYLSLRERPSSSRARSPSIANLNPTVEIHGILPTMYDGARSTRGSGRDAEGELRRPRVRDPHPEDRTYAEAPVQGSSCFQVRPGRERRRGLRDLAGGARWRDAAPACVRARSPSSSGRPRRRSGRRGASPAPRELSRASDPGETVESAAPFGHAEPEPQTPVVEEASCEPSRRRRTDGRARSSRPRARSTEAARAA